MNSTFHNNSTVKLHIVYVIKITEIFYSSMVSYRDHIVISILK